MYEFGVIDNFFSCKLDLFYSGVKLRFYLLSLTLELELNEILLNLLNILGCIPNNTLPLLKSISE